MSVKLKTAYFYSLSSCRRKPADVHGEQDSYHQMNRQRKNCLQREAPKQTVVPCYLSKGALEDNFSGSMAREQVLKSTAWRSTKIWSPRKTDKSTSLWGLFLEVTAKKIGDVQIFSQGSGQEYEYVVSRQAGSRNSFSWLVLAGS